jgi:hypothetical protein
VGVYQVSCKLHSRAIRFGISTGHGRSSFLMRAVDKEGKLIQWYTYPDWICFLRETIKKKSALKFER